MDGAAEQPIVVAHRYAGLAEEARRRGHWQTAAARHRLAAESFAACAALTANGDARGALRQLVELHERSAAQVLRELGAREKAGGGGGSGRGERRERESLQKEMESAHARLSAAFNRFGAVFEEVRAVGKQAVKASTEGARGGRGAPPPPLSGAETREQLLRAYEALRSENRELRRETARVQRANEMVLVAVEDLQADFQFRAQAYTLALRSALRVQVVEQQQQQPPPPQRSNERPSTVSKEHFDAELARLEAQCHSLRQKWAAESKLRRVHQKYVEEAKVQIRRAKQARAAAVAAAAGAAGTRRP